MSRAVKSDIIVNVSGNAVESAGAVMTGHTSYVDESKLAPQYKGSTVVSSIDIDWGVSQTYTKTLTGNTVFTFSNLYVGVKSLILTGNFTVGFPVGFGLTIDSQAFDGTKLNLVSVECWDVGGPTGLVHITYGA